MPLPRLSALATAALLALGAPAGLWLSAPAVALAAEEEILTVHQGASETPVAQFERDQIEALGLHVVRTTTPWTDGVVEFEGVLLRDVLAAAGVAGTTLTVTALNDYSYSFPVQDAHAYPVILAVRMNGADLSRKDKGPLWVVYPRDDHPELDTRETNSRMVWQVHKISVQ